MENQKENSDGFGIENNNIITNVIDPEKSIDAILDNKIKETLVETVESPIIEEVNKQLLDTINNSEDPVDLEENDPKINEQKEKGETRLFRDNKFADKVNMLLYNYDCIKIVEYYLKSCRYLTNIYNSIDESNDKHKIIKELLEENKIEYKIFFEAFVRYNSEFHFGKHRQKCHINDMVITNIDKIVKVIDYVVPLGKVIKLYDPDENLGFY